MGLRGISKGEHGRKPVLAVRDVIGPAPKNAACLQVHARAHVRQRSRPTPRPCARRIPQTRLQWICHLPDNPLLVIGLCAAPLERQAQRRPRHKRATPGNDIKAKQRQITSLATDHHVAGLQL